MSGKEEVLRDCYDERNECFSLWEDEGQDFYDGKASSVFKAMDAYAKEVAIDFLKEVYNNMVVNGVRLANYGTLDIEEVFRRYQQLEPKTNTP